MRISTNQKGMLTTHILGLFLTAALPVSLSLITAPVACAAEKEAVSPIEDKGLQVGIKEILANKTTKSPKLITFNETNRTSEYNLGQAQHDAHNSLILRSEAYGINPFLESLSKNNPLLQKEIAQKGAEKIYGWFISATEGISNRTYTLQTKIIDDIALDLEAATRLYDVIKVSIAYQNVLQEIEETHNADIDKLRKEQKVQHNKLKQELDKKIADLTIKYDKDKEQYNTQITVNTKSLELENKAEKRDSYKIKNYTQIISGLNKSLKEIETKFNEDEKKLEKELTDQKVSDKLLIEKQEKEYEGVKQKFAKELSYIFDTLGTNFTKKATRFLTWRATDRKGFDYALFDLILENNKKPLIEAKSLLREQILTAHQESEFASTAYSKEEILSALLAHLGITDEETLPPLRVPTPVLGDHQETPTKQDSTPVVAEEQTTLLSPQTIPLTQEEITLEEPQPLNEEEKLRDLRAENEALKERLLQIETAKSLPIANDDKVGEPGVAQLDTPVSPVAQSTTPGELKVARNIAATATQTILNPGGLGAESKGIGETTDKQEKKK